MIKRRSTTNNEPLLVIIMRMVYFAIILSLSLFVTDSFYQTYSTTRRPPLLSLSLKASSSPDNINSCVVLYDDDDEYNNTKFLADAENVSKAIGIPLFFASNITTQREEEFTHALRLIPYDYCGEQSTFALAIEPINIFSDNGSRRRKQQRRTTKPKKSSAFYVDLCPPENSRAGRRATGASGTSDLLIQAVAPRKGSIGISSDNNGNRDGAIIYDLTAGLGQDSLFLAMNGAKHVHMVERNPIVGALLQDAMRRLQLISLSSFNVLSECNKSQQHQQQHQTQKELATSLLKKLSLTIGEGKDIIQKQQQQQCDVIYLDPMFPTRQKQSAVKKGMTILHGLLETQNKSIAIDNRQSLQEEKEQEEQDLLLSALDAARLRVVVKRPIKAPLLGGGDEIAKPSYAITGSVNRWDVYVKPQL
jgi:16S rRNA (guanine1516-N2)-methyltransferase